MKEITKSHIRLVDCLILLAILSHSARYDISFDLGAPIALKPLLVVGCVNELGRFKGILVLLPVGGVLVVVVSDSATLLHTRLEEGSRFLRCITFFRSVSLLH
jgi:hypothetical protein